MVKRFVLPSKVTRPPKRSGRARAKAKAKSKAGAHPRAKAKALAMVSPRGGRLRGRLRKPAAEGSRAERTPLENWERGDPVHLVDIPVEQFGPGTTFVVEEGSYFTHKVQYAGIVKGVDIISGEAHFRVQLLGTKSESLLRMHTEKPEELFQMHRCPKACGQELVGDRIIHAMRVRKMYGVETEDPWTRNLQKAEPAPAEQDDLAQLRARAGELPGPAPAEVLPPKEDKEKTKKKKKKKSKKEKKKKAKEKEKKIDTKEDEESSSSTDSLNTGAKCRLACQKSPQVLFRGTGLDGCEKVRSRVARLARRHLRKKTAKGTSSSSSDSGEEESRSKSGDRGGLASEPIFSQTSKVRMIAENYPGALSAQALEAMREVLVSEQGLEESGQFLRATALPYFRQNLQHKCSGPLRRELHTLATAVDHLIRGKVASACDALIQRMKSTEATLSGARWQVAQKMEVLPPEAPGIAGTEEVQSAQKDQYHEARVRMMAAYPDSRAGSGKGSSKAGGGKEDSSKGKSKGKRKGKDQGGKEPRGRAAAADNSGEKT